MTVKKHIQYKESAIRVLLLFLMLTFVGFLSQGDRELQQALNANALATNMINSEPTKVLRIAADAYGQAKGKVDLAPIESNLMRTVAGENNLFYKWSVDLTMPVVKTIISPLNGNVYIFSWDSLVRIIDQNGALLHSFGQHKVELRSADISPDGNIIATGSDDGKLRSYTDSGEFLWEYEVSATDYIFDLKFSPGGNLLAASTTNKLIYLFDPQNGRLIRTLKGHTDGVFRISFSPDGRFILSEQFGAMVKLWDTGSGMELASYGGQNAKVLAGNWSKDGEHYLISEKNSSVSVYDPSNTERKLSISHKNYELGYAEFSPDNSLILSCSGNSIRIFNTNGEETMILKGPVQEQFEAHFSPDGNHVYSLGKAGSIINLWNLEEGTYYKLLNDTTVYDVRFSQDSKLIYSATFGGLVKCWDLEAELIHQLRRAAVDHGGSGDLIAWMDSSLYLFNSKGHAIQKLVDYGNALVSYDVSPSGELIAVEQQTKIILFNGKGDRIRDFEAMASGIKDIQFSPDSKMILVAGADGSGGLFGTNGEQKAALELEGSDYPKVEWSKQGNMFAFLSDSKTLSIFNTEGNLIKRIEGLDHPLNDFCFSNDGSRLAVSTEDGQILMYSAKTMNVEHSFERGRFDYTPFIRFSSDDKYLISTFDMGQNPTIWTVDGTRVLEFPSIGALEIGATIQSNAGDFFLVYSGSWEEGAEECILFDYKSNELLRIDNIPMNIQDAEFSHDDRFIIITTLDGTRYIY